MESENIFADKNVHNVSILKSFILLAMCFYDVSFIHKID